MMQIVIKTKRIDFKLVIGGDATAEEGGNSGETPIHAKTPIEVSSDVDNDVDNNVDNNDEQTSDTRSYIEELLNQKTHISDLANQYAKELSTETKNRVVSLEEERVLPPKNNVIPPTYVNTRSSNETTHGMYDLTGDNDHLSEEFTSEDVLYPSVEIIDDDYERQLERVSISQNKRYLTYASTKGAMYEEYTE